VGFEKGWGANQVLSQKAQESERKYQCFCKSGAWAPYPPPHGPDIYNSKLVENKRAELMK